MKKTKVNSEWSYFYSDKTLTFQRWDGQEEHFSVKSKKAADKLIKELLREPVLWQLDLTPHEVMTVLSRGFTTMSAASFIEDTIHQTLSSYAADYSPLEAIRFAISHLHYDFLVNASDTLRENAGVWFKGTSLEGAQLDADMLFSPEAAAFSLEWDGAIYRISTPDGYTFEVKEVS